MGKHAGAPKRSKGDRSMVTTTFRIYKDQRDALQQRAMQQRTAGRVDASAVLRELLDRSGFKA
jgi:hypothetical protein